MEANYIVERITLKQQLSDCESKNEELIYELSEVRKHLSDSETECNELDQELYDAYSENEGLEQELSDTLSEKKRLKQGLSKVEKWLSDSESKNGKLTIDNTVMKTIMDMRLVPEKNMLQDILDNAVKERWRIDESSGTLVARDVRGQAIHYNGVPISMEIWVLLLAKEKPSLFKPVSLFKRLKGKLWLFRRRPKLWKKIGAWVTAVIAAIGTVIAAIGTAIPQIREAIWQIWQLLQLTM